jgi:hypothetical protein
MEVAFEQKSFHRYRSNLKDQFNRKHAALLESFFPVIAALSINILIFF